MCNHNPCGITTQSPKSESTDSYGSGDNTRNPPNRCATCGSDRHRIHSQLESFLVTVNQAKGVDIVDGVIADVGVEIGALPKEFGVVGRIRPPYLLQSF